MSPKFKDLAQANVDHYNEHPVMHTTAVAAYTVVAVALIHKVARRVAESGNDPYRLSLRRY